MLGLVRTMAVLRRIVRWEMGTEMLLGKAKSEIIFSR